MSDKPESVASVVMPPCDHGRIEVCVRVPPVDRRNKAHDIAEAYAVEVADDIPGGCIIWGLYHGQWLANVSARWLMMQFVHASQQMLDEEHSGGNGWWAGWDSLKELIHPPA